MAKRPFKVGEVVADRFKPINFHKIIRVSKDGDSVYFEHESTSPQGRLIKSIHHYGNAHSYFRHLTPRERGGLK